MKVIPFKVGDLVKTKCGKCIGLIEVQSTNLWGKGYTGTYCEKDSFGFRKPVYSLELIKGNKVAWYDHEELELLESGFKNKQNKLILKKYNKG